MSALTVVQTVCLELGLNVPNSVASSSDPQIKQILALANRTGKELADRYDWQALTKQATFTTVNLESQGMVETLAPGYKKIVNETIWDRDLIRPVVGPETSKRWALLLARRFSGPYSQYRIRGGELIATPAPPAGHTWSFEYVTNHWVSDVDNTTSREEYTADEDYSLINEDLIALGTIWRWMQRKGFTYSEDFAEYERRVANAIGSDGMKPTLHAGDQFPTLPGVIVPEGSWGSGSWNS